MTKFVNWCRPRTNLNQFEYKKARRKATYPIVFKVFLLHDLFYAFIPSPDNPAHTDGLRQSMGGTSQCHIRRYRYTSVTNHQTELHGSAASTDAYGTGTYSEREQPSREALFTTFGVRVKTRQFVQPGCRAADTSVSQIKPVPDQPRCLQRLPDRQTGESAPGKYRVLPALQAYRLNESWRPDVE